MGAFRVTLKGCYKTFNGTGVNVLTTLSFGETLNKRMFSLIELIKKLLEKKSAGHRHLVPYSTIIGWEKILAN